MRVGHPYNGIPILTKYKHDSKVGKVVMDQDACDFAPTLFMKLIGATGIYLPREAKILKIMTRIEGKRDGYIVYQTKDKVVHYRVHCIARGKIKVGSTYPMGTRVATIDPKPVNATGMHDHHFMLLAGKPIDIFGWYSRRGIVGWYQDPMKLKKD